MCICTIIEHRCTHCEAVLSRSYDISRCENTRRGARCCNVVENDPTIQVIRTTKCFRCREQDHKLHPTKNIRERYYNR
ncbi:hypothetical protein BAUCODRAFT_30271 [Baudoinia panamericana UAMH 10762]|uniref:Uncharacterized protein n=1 Tax=Baudoinia panamericana (strain UAMH 10762) TaxID=717646 RepID=M2MSK2_BAUPA|nr:uncharacterized protein BAUCODRAFT_30271 [Baudoinia panamericana UAMH 10762]EMC99856.1 hypothetical protein BAUCODRAFT_30271 [Baudoinia panamericana UAMH 10762]